MSFFFNSFQTPEDEAQGYKTYLEQIEVMKHDTRNTLFIDFDHMLQFKEGVMAQAIQEGFFRLNSILLLFVTMKKERNEI